MTGKYRLHRPWRFVLPVISLLVFANLVSFGELVHATGRVDAVESGATRFLRTVKYVQQIAPELESDFAAIALNVLATVHAREAALAREEIQSGGPNGKLQNWSLAVDEYARDLSQLREAILQGADVTTAIDENGAVSVTVDRQSTILFHPRVTQQSTFEQNILIDFCTLHPCDTFFPAEHELEPIPVSTAQVRPAWSFTESGPVCSHQGIQVKFSGRADVARARLTCEQFLQEVMTLTDEFNWQRRHGVVIEWGGVQIFPVPGAPEYRIRLNRAGDSILLVVPVLYGSEGLLDDIRPWIQQRLERDGSGSVHLEAARYGWE